MLFSTLNSMNRENIEKTKSVENLKIEVGELERCLEGKETEIASLLQKLEEEKENLQREVQLVAIFSTPSVIQLNNINLTTMRK